MTSPLALTRTYSPPQVAEFLGITVDKCLAWIRAGELTAIDVANHGSRRPRFRITVEALDRFVQARTVSPPPARVARRRRAESMEEEVYK